MSEKKKYLYLKMEGHEAMSLFPKRNKEGKQPDYVSIGGGVAVWVREYVPKQEESKTEKPSGLDVSL